MARFDGKVCFVTGAAGGQGRANALRIAHEGADVMLSDLSTPITGLDVQMETEEALEETALLVRRHGRRALTCPADVRDQGSLDAAVAMALEEYGHIDVVSATASIVHGGTIGDLGEQAWRQLIDVNFSGTWRTAKAVIPPMRAAGSGGCIVLGASSAGLQGYAGCSHYVAAAHAIVRMTRTLALELAADNIRVNALCPGGRSDAAARLEGPPRLASAEDLASAASAFCWLASDAAGYVTGIALPIDAAADE
jgi:(+)-trans-carveol dehydrogenase